MKKTIKFAAIFGFVFLAIGFISSLFFHNLSLIERLGSAIMLMSTVGFADIQIPRIPGIICSISGALAFLSFFLAIILCIVRWIIKIAAKEIENEKIKSA